MTMSLSASKKFRDLVTFIQPGRLEDAERDSLVDISPRGFFIRHPPKPHELDMEVTTEQQLFQTIHMGAAVVDRTRWSLVFDGLVERSFSINFNQLMQMPQKHITSFHGCYGSPVAPPTNAVWRVGNVTWTGVSLAELLAIAKPKPKAAYIWTDGLENGTFAGVSADRYQKDLPTNKAMAPDVTLAYKMNGEPLTKERGGPVRLVVPGWFSTNSTKWICRVSLQDSRSQSPYTTTFYNEIDPTDPMGRRKRPVWKVEPNSIIVRPRPGEVLSRGVQVWGRAWGCDEIVKVEISIDEGASWGIAELTPRKGFEWQLFKYTIADTPVGLLRITARATDTRGVQQPLSGRRNPVHTVTVHIQDA